MSDQSPRRAALVTGAPQRVKAVAAALEDAGYDVTSVTDRARVAETCGQLPARSLDCYVQLPGDVPAEGDTVVARARSFLSEGLLARYDAAACVTPLLAENAMVVLATGNHPPAAALPDDQTARVALLRVLAHAILADRSDCGVRVTVVGGQRTPSEIAAVVEQRNGERLRVLAERVATDSDLSYADWRVQMLQIATTED